MILSAKPGLVPIRLFVAAPHHRATRTSWAVPPYPPTFPYLKFRHGHRVDEISLLRLIS